MTVARPIDLSRLTEFRGRNRGLEVGLQRGLGLGLGPVTDQGDRLLKDGRRLTDRQRQVEVLVTTPYAMGVGSV